MIDNEKIDQLKQILAVKSQITVVSHVNPDGDAIGSGLAWTRILESMGHRVRFIVPNNYPAFLEWMTDIAYVNVFKIEPESNEKFIADSNVIFCMDFNQIHRLEGLGAAIEKNTTAPKILIDHHLEPPEIYDLSFSDTSASSTAFLTYRLIESLGITEAISYSIAESLYVGISTDTGNFTFGNLSPELFRAVACLVEKGLNTPALNIAIYNNFSADRMRLMGYVLNEKMTLIKGYRVAYMTLDKEEQLKYNFHQGDSEGFVNLPLSIKDISMSAFFIQTKECVKVSLRSQGDIDVNAMARKYFNGGGHKNAAGGRLNEPLSRVVEIFKEAVKSELKQY